MTDEMPEFHCKVVDELRNHRGRENAVTSDELADALEMSDSATNRLIRKGIRELTAEWNVPVASCPSGFYLIETDAELADYVANLMNRKNGLQQRIENVREAYQKPTEVEI